MEPEHHWMRERMPFAVVGSNMTITDPSTGQMYRGREYPWGCVNIEDKVGTLVITLYEKMYFHQSSYFWENQN